MKRTGVLVGNFTKNPKRYQDPVLWAWLEIFFSPKRYQFLHNALSPVIFLRLNTLKGTAKKTSHYGPFKA